MKACGIGAGCEDARVGGDDLVSLFDGEAECQKVGDGRAASAQFGKELQIQILTCGAWLGQAFEGDAAGIALQLGDECRVCLPRGGTEAYVDAGFRSQTGDVVRATSAERHVDNEDRLVSHRH